MSCAPAGGSQSKTAKQGHCHLHWRNHRCVQDSVSFSLLTLFAMLCKVQPPRASVISPVRKGGETVGHKYYEKDEAPHGVTSTGGRDRTPHLPADGPRRRDLPPQHWEVCRWTPCAPLGRAALPETVDPVLVIPFPPPTFCLYSFLFYSSRSACPFAGWNVSHSTISC